MDRKITFLIIFENRKIYTVIEKHKLYCHKNPILIDDVDINKIIECNLVSFGKKGFNCFIGYKDNEKVLYNALKNELIKKIF